MLLSSLDSRKSSSSKERSSVRLVLTGFSRSTVFIRRISWNRWSKLWGWSKRVWKGTRNKELLWTKSKSSLLIKLIT